MGCICGKGANTNKVQADILEPQRLETLPGKNAFYQKKSKVRRTRTPPFPDTVRLSYWESGLLRRERMLCGRR